MVRIYRVASNCATIAIPPLSESFGSRFPLFTPTPAFSHFGDGVHFAFPLGQQGATRSSTVTINASRRSVRPISFGLTCHSRRQPFEFEPHKPEPDGDLHQPDLQRDVHSDSRIMFTLIGLADLGCLVLLPCVVTLLFVFAPMRLTLCVPNRWMSTCRISDHRSRFLNFQVVKVSSIRVLQIEKQGLPPTTDQVIPGGFTNGGRTFYSDNELF